MQPAPPPILPPDLALAVENARRALIAALNTLDDVSGRERTVPSADARRKAARCDTTEVK